MPHLSLIPHLSIIIVSYNTCELLRACLASVYRSAAATAAHLSIDVIVVDNASRDGSAEMVRNEFPLAHLIASPDNLGFTKGNNLALRELGISGSVDSGSEVSEPVVSESVTTHQASPNRQSAIGNPQFAILLNPDTEVVGDALWQMVEVLMRDPTAGACGAHLRYGDSSFQHGAFHFPSLAQVALDFFPLTGLAGVHRLHNSALNGRYPQALWQGSQPFAVDFVLGAALMVRTSAIQQVGLLDEGFFMYCEEMDWCLRLRDAGWQILAVPGARITHHEGRSSRQVRWQAYVWLWQSRLHFYQKHPRHYTALNRWAVRWLIRLGIGWRKRIVRQCFARQCFAKGQVDGEALAAELSAYESVENLMRDA